jgi:hypothetical protein
MLEVLEVPDSSDKVALVSNNSILVRTTITQMTKAAVVDNEIMPKPYSAPVPRII